MKLAGWLAVIGAIGYVLFTYWNGSGQLRQIRDGMRNVEKNQRAQELLRIKQRYWAGFYQAPKDCGSPPSALRELECRNQARQAWERFDAQWERRIASGWIPPELPK